MHLHFEQNISSRTECTLHSLTWMGKVPDSLPGDTNNGWKLNRGQYYSEGWLASGNAKGIVGVTFTTSHCRKYDPPNRSNFNLRGHRSEVVLVRWNEPYQKLATCDAQGIIFVWIKHEGRWSIELINDRNSQVTDFAWSHDGRMALICYCDGFVLVGSVAGQRYWSSMLNLDNTSITCGVWSPDDQKVFFGTTDGQIIIMSSTGAMVSQVTILEGMEITTLLWSCEKFNMEESESNRDSGIKVSSDTDSPTVEKTHTLAVCFKYGAIYLMNNYDDVCPRVVHTMLTGLRLDWSNCGQYLAVGGFTRLPNLQCQNEIHFYSPSGQLRHWVSVPSQGKPLTALCWGHNDMRLFVAAGHNLYVTWVVKHVPKLQYLCQRIVQKAVKNVRNVSQLPLPVKLNDNVQALFSPTIKSYIPDPFKLREFVSTPPPGSERLFCTMVRHGEETSGGHYTLYLEYLGGLIPLLKGKRASKLRPDFVIFDPKIKAKTFRKDEGESPVYIETDLTSSSSSSDSDIETDVCGSPRTQRKKRQKNFRAEKVERSTTFRTLNELFYNDSLPESSKLVEVQSNIWGTKFRIIGTAIHLPEDLGNVLYKTSLLHLQPRQMTVTVTELPKDDLLLSQDRNFTPAGLGEEENGSMLDGLSSGVFNEQLSNQNIPRNNYLDLTNQDSEIISVDVLTNQIEISNHMDKMADHDSAISSVGCYSERQKPVLMTTKLSPASETHPQNNHAFNISDTPVIENYIREGARPKVLPQQPFSLNETSENDSGILSVTANSNRINSAHSNSALSNVHSSKVLSSQDGVTSDFKLNGDVVVEEIRSSDANTSSNSQGAPKSVPSFVDRFIRLDIQDDTPRWADPACQGIKYVDDDDGSLNKDTVYETNSICDSSQVVTPTAESPRLYLQDSEDLQSWEVESADKVKLCDPVVTSRDLMSHWKLSNQNSVDSVETLNDGTVASSSENLTDQYMSDRDSIATGNGSLETGINLLNGTTGSMETGINVLKGNGSVKTGLDLLSACNRKSSLTRHMDKFDITQSASLPNSPVHRLHKPDSPSKVIKEEALKAKCKHHSPLFKRKSKFGKGVDNSDEDFSSVEDMRMAFNFKNLESFQKAQVKQKMKRARTKGDDRRVSRQYSRQFAMHNKAPLWNENSQVYQLDFGGRVTQESAKNFQIEFKGKQVMQFGRIDSNAYTLDFQYPFTAIQAFAVALANVTQRLK